MTAALFPLPLEEGANNPNVNMVQYFLQTLKLYPEPIDGVFGPKTKAEVIKFQQSQGLTADGVVGAKTWSSLYTLGMDPNVPVQERISLIFNVSDC